MTSRLMFTLCKLVSWWRFTPRFNARPLNHFTRVESFQPDVRVIQWIQFNRRHPVVEVAGSSGKAYQVLAPIVLLGGIAYFHSGFHILRSFNLTVNVLCFCPSRIIKKCNIMQAQMKVYKREPLTIKWQKHTKRKVEGEGNGKEKGKWEVKLGWNEYIEYPVARFLKVPELPDSKYSDPIVDQFCFPTSSNKTWPVQAAGSLRITVLFCFWKQQLSLFISINLSIISQIVCFCFDNNQ